MSNVNFSLLFSAIFAMFCPCEVSAKSISWGLPGSSRTAFESGSHRCAIDVARRDVSADKPTKKFLRGFEVLERENNMPPMDGQGLEDDVTRARRQVLLRRAYGTDKHIDSLQDNLQNELRDCLIRAGYIEFTLTKAQEKRLAKLKRGSESRAKYLYELGSDKKIVPAQRIR